MNNKPSILIVDDDKNVLEVIEARLFSSGYRVFKAGSPEKALDILKNRQVQLMISDMKMPGMGGMDLFQEVREFLPDLPVIFLTAYGTIPDAVKAMQAGAVDYIAKPFDGKDLLKKIGSVLKRKRAAFAGGDDNHVTPPDTAKSTAMRELYELIERVANSHVSVLILGESGAGKEYAARMIHQLSPRRDAPFAVVDCGSTPSTLLESELFGHVKGAFTHAIRDKKGLIEEADQGTLFLDEIGNISSEMQMRLLRFLEGRQIRRIGGLREIPVDCRVIAATHSDLNEDIASGRFREDLYYRLRVVTLTIPALRERREDIPHLVTHFVGTFCRENNLPPVDIPDETNKWLTSYPWPGNVRELKNALEAGVVLCQNGTLRIEDMRMAGLPEIEIDSLAEGSSFSLEESERQAIIRALEQTGGVQKNAADLLGISRRAIHYKIKKYAIDLAAIKASGGKSSR